MKRFNLLNERYIPLTKNQYTIVDKEDFNKIKNYSWYTLKCGKNMYAVNNINKDNGKRTLRMMHRILFECPNNMDIDHINRNGLDNRKSNLRIATRSQNIMNSDTSQRKDKTSKFKGVSWHNYGKGKWRARILNNDRCINLGLFDTEKEAAIAYNSAAIKYYVEFAKLNEFEEHE